MNLIDKLKFRKHNEEIIGAIKLSRITEADGFNVLEKFLEEKLNQYSRPDIRILAQNRELIDVYNGYVQMIDELKYFLTYQKTLSLKPMIDEETGEVEKIRTFKK